MLPVVLVVVVCHLTGARGYLINIGAVLEPGNTTEFFERAVLEVNALHNVLPPSLKLNATAVALDRNPIRTAQSVCDNLISKQVYAVIIGQPESGDLSPAAVSYTCGFYDIPVIGISSRDSSLSDKNLHSSFLRTVPPFSHQADVWIHLLRHFRYRCVVVLHSSDTDGRAALTRFQNLAHHSNIKVEAVIEYEHGISNLGEKLTNIKDFFCRVFVLYANAKDAEMAFAEVEHHNLTGPGYAWIVSEQALAASNVPEGVLGVTLANRTDEAGHLYDSVHVIALALKELFLRDNLTMPPKSCGETKTAWSTGLTFVKYLKQQTLLYGKTGRVAFDHQGDRLDNDYHIVNYVGGEVVVVGELYYSQDKLAAEMDIDLDRIIWPGSSTEKPVGYLVPKHLKIVTIAEKPFVFVRPLNDPEESCMSSEMYCPLRNRSDGERYGYCCRGYCIDLLVALSDKLNFTYELYQVEDGQYGSYDAVTKLWTGMVGDIVSDNADLIIAPLTINPERAIVIDFSKPFKYQGITILERKHPKTSTLGSFKQPFQNTLWLLVVLSVFLVALVLYLLDRFSPFGRFKSNAEEDGLNFASAIWFAWAVLLNSGIGEATPRSFSGRVLGMVWAGFAMIVVASYTANLAAFLVLDRPQTSLSGIGDARLRNPTENFTYATVKGSAVDMYFRRQVELSNMYRTMEGKNFDTPEEAITAVKLGRLNAFIWDSSRLEFEAAQDCELVTAGEQFGRSGYGVGLRKNSFWTDDITLALLIMHESGYMEKLDNRWILQGTHRCERTEKFPATLGLKNMAGVFILVGAGIVIGLFLICFEIIYKKYQNKKQQKLAMTRIAVDRWRGNVERRKMMRSLRSSRYPRNAFSQLSLDLPPASLTF